MPQRVGQRATRRSGCSAQPGRKHQVKSCDRVSSTHKHDWPSDAVGLGGYDGARSRLSISAISASRTSSSSSRIRPACRPWSSPSPRAGAVTAGSASSPLTRSPATFTGSLGPARRAIRRRHRRPTECASPRTPARPGTRPIRTLATSPTSCPPRTRSPGKPSPPVGPWRLPRRPSEELPLAVIMCLGDERRPGRTAIAEEN